MKNKGKKINRIEQAVIEEIINRSNSAAEISDSDQAEMAIPSYLNQNPLIREIFWRRYDRVYKLAKFSPEMTVCEFGCGIGVFLPVLARETAEVYAIDLFPQYAQMLASEFDLNVKFSKSLDIVPDNSLDILFAAEVLDPLDDLDAGIQLLARKLKPGGRLIMSGPTESLIYKIGRFLVGYNKYHDYHRNNVYDIRQAILENGFSLERTIYFPNRVILLNLICSFRVNK